MLRNSIWVVIFLLVVMACKPGVPGRYIQPKQMENLLYDYHWLNGYAEDEYLDSATKAEYVALLLKKHGVTQAEFDSSMVYYMRHTREMHAIYKNLSDRFAADAKLYGAGDLLADGYSLTGDTADIWNTGRIHMLLNKAPYNHVQFAVTEDSLFRPGDRIIYSANNDFFYEDGTRNAVAVLVVKFANDSICTRASNLHSSMTSRLEISDDNRIGIKSVKGMILHRESSMEEYRNSNATRLMLVSNIHLLRMHTPEPEQSDSVKVDSLKTQSSVTTMNNSGLQGGVPPSASGPSNMRILKRPDVVKPVNAVKK